ncbi:methyltransferase domain-containing protein [Salicibibacter cibi]|uniref:Methyltransferase domain-containing protein n=1 Tax=Salicibibacter cibi TaxID=2743001 RepID=A0A7T6ZEP5_9BACI|nr:methyltransferase domain-containing protein [Salicibibacter cibi]QQK81912.1 methyltransferase domain-containing protein [Salicibibacter cibi]
MNHALHHFKNKDQVLTEIHRILKNGGIYELHNISIHDMPKWWIYYYFPSAYDEDVKRYWSKVTIFNELSNLGFKAQLKIGYRMEEVKAADYLDHAENRGISVLTLINDEDYKQGCERLKYDVKKDRQSTITNDFAEMFCIAMK